jgi:putative tricarboxylic transport membrane protein
MKTANIVSSFIAILIAAFFFIMTYQFKDIDVQDTGPAFMPRLYAGILIVLAFLLIVNSMRSKLKEQKNDSGSNFKLVFITMVLMTGLIILIPFIGFYISAPIVIFIFLKICKQKNLFLLIGLPLGVILFVYLLFERLLLVPIPTGSIFQ